MKITRIQMMLPLLLFFLASCSNKSEKLDLVHTDFTEYQNEIRKVVNTIVQDAEIANLEGLKNSHLASEKFTKFGPRNFERQNVEKTNESELAFFGTVSNYREEIKDLKIDVFGEVGIATFYRAVEFAEDNEQKTVNLRQTLVFLRTDDGWKIVHEHGTRPM